LGAAALGTGGACCFLPAAAVLVEAIAGLSLTRAMHDARRSRDYMRLRFLRSRRLGPGSGWEISM